MVLTQLHNPSVSKILLHERDINIPAEDPEWQQRALMVCDQALAWSRVEVMRQIRDRMLLDGFVEVDSAYSHYYYPLPISTIYNAIPVIEILSYCSNLYRLERICESLSVPTLENSITENV